MPKKSSYFRLNAIHVFDGTLTKFPRKSQEGFSVAADLQYQTSF
jgi:hypothetical protein